jgi:hypothetical protein
MTARTAEISANDSSIALRQKGVCKLAVNPTSGVGRDRVRVDLRLTNVVAFDAAQGPILEARTRWNGPLDRHASSGRLFGENDDCASDITSHPKLTDNHRDAGDRANLADRLLIPWSILLTFKDLTAGLTFLSL